MKRPELLSPAGNLTKLKIALAYGADAVYASVGGFSLRQRSAKEFDPQSFAEGVNYAHEKGAKFYATANGFMYNGAIEAAKKHLAWLDEIGVDGIIIAAPGTINLAKEFAPHTQIHLSTQANVTNFLDAKFYYDMGVSRIVAAREISLKDLVKIKKELPNLEFEMFCHGSMCFAYSGRCLLSAVQSNRSSNKGMCANDCRFGYELYAKNSESGALFRLEENEQGETMVFNAKDLNLISHIDEIVRSGAIDSLKIEGRTKSEYYAACATRAYKMAIDDSVAGKFDASVYEAELQTLTNRGFTDGYIVNKPYERVDTQNFENSSVKGSCEVCGLSEDGENLSVKFTIKPLKEYGILLPFGAKITPIKNQIGEIFEKNGKAFVKFYKLLTKTGKEFSEIHSGNLNQILLPTKLEKFTFLRIDIKDV